jgi:hypothetical protein
VKQFVPTLNPLTVDTGEFELENVPLPLATVQVPTAGKVGEFAPRFTIDVVLQML